MEDDTIKLLEQINKSNTKKLANENMENIKKSKKIEIIGFSLDTEKSAYESRVAALPWINDSELRGWNSSFTETYNVHATPTYFVLDSENKIIAKPDHASDVLQFFGLK